MSWHSLITAAWSETILDDRKMHVTVPHILSGQLAEEIVLRHGWQQRCRNSLWGSVGSVFGMVLSKKMLIPSSDKYDRKAEKKLSSGKIIKKYKFKSFKLLRVTCRQHSPAVKKANTWIYLFSLDRRVKV